MKKKLLVLFILLVVLFTAIIACKPVNQRADYPVFWTWLDYRSEMNFDSICRVMERIGIDGVMLNAPTPEDYEQVIPIAEKYDIEVYAWLWTLNLEHDREKILQDHPEWFSVNRVGNSLADTTAYVDYYKFLSPILPEVRKFIGDKVRSYCEIEGLKGISIDYNRLVDVVLPTTLWPTYGIVQDKEYAEWDYGYHPAMLKRFKAEYGYDPRELDDPSQDTTWRNFRCDQVSEVANLIAEIVNSYGKKMAASPFPTPKMASRMVRQNWKDWRLDIVFPMVYHNFYTEDVSFIADCMIENSRDKRVDTELYCGIMVAEGQELFDAMDAAFAHGAQGISLFTITMLQSEEMLNRFKLYTDSIKRVKRDNGGLIPAKYPQSAEIDPFKHNGVLLLVEQCMQKLLQEEDGKGVVAPLNLSDYRLVKQFDATKYYEVIDEVSNRAFRVSFYFYGGVLSGWNVALIAN